MTLQEIADASQTSSSAVSVVLHGAKSGTRVSKAKRIAILTEAKRLGYVDRNTVYGERIMRSRRIAVVNTGPFDERDDYFYELLGGILEQASKSKLNAFIYTGGADEVALSEFLLASPGGIILSSVGNFDPLPQIIAENTPIVAIGEPFDGVPSVVVDDYTGGRLQAQHLISEGHRRFLLKTDPLRRYSTEMRLAGFKNGLSGHQTSFVESPECNTCTGDPLCTDDIRILAWDSCPATAIVCWADHVAESITTMLCSMGIDVPSQVAVIGFNGLPWYGTPKKSLTTIVAPWRKVGSESMSLLESMINGSQAPALTVLPVRFLRGETT